MTKPNKLAIAVRNVILSVTGVALIPALALGQEAKDDKKGNIEEVYVTGTHIKRSNFSENSQVVVMDEVKIEAQSALVMSDILRSSPLNSYGSFSEQSGSSAQSNATVDLRGLGAQRTLVTFDGRRMVGSPNFGAAIINVNMIPHAAIKSIDILADGASAVYGSDAVAGVVNMQTQKGFEGLEFKATYGDRDRDDGTEYSYSLLGGLTNEKGNITFALEKSRRDAIYDADRSYTAARAADLNGDGVIQGYTDETEGYSYYGKTIEIYDPNTGYDDIQAATSCETGGNFVLGSLDDAFGLEGSTSCLYAYANASANKAGIDKTSMYLNATYDVGENHQFFISSLISKVESFGRFAPAAAEWPDMPSDHSDVPFDIDALLDSGAITEDYEIYGYYRWTTLGTRDNNVTDTLYDFTVGFEGDFSDNVSYQIYLQDSSYYSKEYGYYYLSVPGLDYALSKGWDLFSDDAINAMSAVPTQDNFSKMAKVYGHVQAGVGNWFGAGDSIILVGGESYSMEYQNKYDRHSQGTSEGELVGGSAGNSSNGDRDVNALFVEMVAPITETLEVNGAVRYDEYSDFGSAVSPTLGVNWAVTDAITLRGRVSQGFRAPALDELYGPSSFSAEEAIDVVGCLDDGTSVADCPTVQYETYYETNPDLEAEDSNSFSAGVNWQALTNLTIDVSYWDINVENLITSPTTQESFYAEAAGIDVTSGPVVVERNGARPIIHSTMTNDGELEASGLDFQINAFIDTKIGTFSTDFLTSYTLSYKQAPYYTHPAQETSGFNLQPEIKTQWGFGWELASHRVDLTIDYIGPSSQFDSVSTPGENATTEEQANWDYKLITSDKDLDSWTTMNLSYSYESGDFGTVKIGARNLTDEDPVFDKDEKFPADHYDLYDQTGRVMYLEYTIKF